MSEAAFLQAIMDDPDNVRHKVVTLDQPARAIDIFSPIRDNYL